MQAQHSIQGIDHRGSSDSASHDDPVHILQVEETRDAVTHGHRAHGHIAH